MRAKGAEKLRLSACVQLLSAAGSGHGEKRKAKSPGQIFQPGHNKDGMAG